MIVAGGTDGDITSMSATVDSNAMTLDVFSQSAAGQFGDRSFVAIFSLAWPSGTTADFTWTTTTSTLFTEGAFFYATYDTDTASDTATDSGSDLNGTGDATLTLSVDTAVDSIVLGGAYHYNGPNATAWTGITGDDTDVIFGSHYWSVGSLKETSAATPRTVTGAVDLTDSTGRVWAGASVVYPASVGAAGNIAWVRA